jgi:hypothetical protein
MFTCSKCNKEFKFEYEFKRHNNRKIPCNSIKNFNCASCNKSFKYKSKLNEHEKTNKHLLQINKFIVNGNNHIGDNINNTNSYNNIIHLTLNTNSFINTDMSYIGRGIINDIGQIYLDILEKKYFSNNDRCILLFDEVLHILEKLHFNIGVEENHNLKILLVFPALKNSVYENLILEIDNTTKQISWRSVNYETLISNILDHLLILNERVKNENFINFVNFLKKYLIDDADTAEELEPIINKKLSQMYVNFNIKQNKPDRDVKFSFNEKLQEYINYRNNELTLINGFAPDVVNSQF